IAFIGVSYAGEFPTQKLLSKRVTLSVTDTKIETVLDELSKQSRARFVYSHEVIGAGRKISLKMENKRLEEVLDELTRTMGITYSVTPTGSILLKKLEESFLQQINSGSAQPPLQSLTKERVVKGKGTDENGEVLPGVTIMIDKSTRGVTTDLDGSFEIKASSTDVLVVSFIGMITQEIAVGEQNEFEIVLKQASSELKEVTVVAFGTQKKESVIGSITTVSPKDLKAPTSNLTTVLAGKMSGVIAYQRSGEPGQDNADFF